MQRHGDIIDAVKERMQCKGFNVSVSLFVNDIHQSLIE
ncbi:MAG: hypothetical protein ACI9LX_003869 [Paraglaciecola sp.]|jgi:hypothetical protein